MAFDTDNNIAVQGFSGEAVVATDYVATEGNHFQVVKLAYGTPGVTGSANRVTSSSPLPVNVLNNPTVSVSSIGSTVSVAGTVSVTQPVGVTATDLDIRNLTAGSVTAGSPSTSTVDIVRVIGYSGGWPVGVTATNFGIRALTAGDPTTAGAVGQDTVRIVGYSGGWPVGVTAVDLDIRSLTYGSDSVSVLNTAQVKNSSDPFTATPNSNPVDGLNTRVLRASPGAVPENSLAAISSQYLAYNGGAGNAEDTVRVVGLSGAWPVNTFLHGLTNINNYDTKVPLSVDSTGALFVNLASGSVSITADVSGLAGLTLTLGSALTIAGVSAANATSAGQVLQVHGYTGTGFIPITVTASDLDIRGLSSSTDSVAVTGSVSVSNQPGFSFDGNSQLKVVEGSASSLANSMSNLSTSVSNLSTAFGSAASSSLTSTTNGIKMLKVDVQNIAQPTGGTYGSINVTSAVALGNQALQSGVHLKSASGNQGIIRVGFNNQVATVGFPLDAGDQLFIETNNTSNIFVAANTGCTLSYIGT